MESSQEILPEEIHQTIANNQISHITLKDGTILKISESNQLTQNNQIIKDKTSLINRRKNKDKKENEQKNANDKGIHNHYKDSIGSFGQHFQTEYSQVCPDCTEGPGGIIKQRKNYVLYASKNITEANISKKHKNNCDHQVQQKTSNQENIQIVNERNVKNKGEKVISRGTVEVNDKPVIEPKTILRNERGEEKVCPECSEAEKIQNNQLNQGGEYLCPECEQEENINEEKITTTVKVLVPDNE